MDLIQAIEQRHSVRNYTDKKIEGEVLKELKELISQCNKVSGLNIQLILNEDQGFSGIIAKYGKFSNVKNYIAIVGKSQNNLEEMVGYYGEKIVIKAQQLGLSTCWVAFTFNKRKSKKSININTGEKLVIVISIGYGTDKGRSHKRESIETLSNISELEPPIPEWFIAGMKAVQLAPSAMNQQKYRFYLENNNEIVTSAGMGFYTKLDLGIAKYHFEVGANSIDDHKWSWK